MILIVAKNKLKQGKRDEFLKLARKMEVESRKEEGCVSYVIYEDMQDSNSFCFIEEYKDQSAVDFHNQSPHFKSIVSLITELRESSDVVKYQLPV